MSLRTTLNVDLLSEAELEQVFQAAVRLWREIPFRIQGTDELLDHLSAYGCRIDGERVYGTDAVIDKVLARVREAKQQWLAENRTRQTDWPPSDIYMYTHGQSLYACDLETNALRPATEGDLAEWCHVVDHLGDVTREHPTFIPTEVPTGSADFHAFATIVLNSRQAHRVSLYNHHMLPYFIEASTIAMGSLDAVKADPPFATKMWVNSPFMITRENVEIAMDARRLLGVPITPGVMPVAGASTPITVSGALAHSTAECLALNALCLAVDDRLVGICANPLVMDMADAIHRQSGPDVMLHMLATRQMHAYLFGGHATLNGFNTGAQVVCAQSVYEKGMGGALTILSGGRALGIGSLAFSDVGSLVQLALDYEMGLFFRHLLREVVVDPDHIGEQTILDTTPRGAYYLDTEHTARFFREASWLAPLMDYRPPAAWMQDPDDMIARARAKARQWVADAENQCPLSADQQAGIRRLIGEADRAAHETTTR